jgi:hypothetical protein
MSNLPLGFRTSRAIGESNARRAVRGGRSRVYVLSIPVIQLGFAISSNPRARVFTRLKHYLRSGRAPTFDRLRRASSFALRATADESPTASLSLCRVPPRAPQRGASPNHQRAGCPRVALPRVNPDHAAATNPPQHIGTVPVAKAPCTDPQ